MKHALRTSRLYALSFSAIAALAVGWLTPAQAELPVMRLAAVSNVALSLPHDMTLTPDGRYLVVADMGNSRVVFLDPTTLALRHVIGEEMMSFPHDVTFDPQGHLLVADSGNDRILVYSLEDLQIKLINVWSGLDGPEGIAVTPDGKIYVSLVGENRLAQIQDGRVVASVQSALGMDLDRPHDIEVVKDAYGVSLILADAGNHRLIVFNEELRPLYEISTWDPPFSEPKYLSANDNGLIFVADQYNNRIRVFNSASKQLGQFALDTVKLPEGVFVKDDHVWVSDTEGGRVLLYMQGKTP